MQKPQMRLRPIETSNSDAKVAVLHAHNDRSGLGTMETSNSGANHLFYMHKTRGEVWDP